MLSDVIPQDYEPSMEFNYHDSRGTQVQNILFSDDINPLDLSSNQVMSIKDILQVYELAFAILDNVFNNDFKPSSDYQVLYTVM